jgi:hypothetical protein
MNRPPPFQMIAVMPGYPAATFRAWITAELAEDTIPATCPHSAGVRWLYLPSRVMRCRGCIGLERPDSTPGPCASCDAPGACTWTWWIDEEARVIVTARVCVPCGTDGTVPLCPN